VLAALEWIPDKRYELLDEVGDAIVRRQPSFAPDSPEPVPESGEVPGGEAYVDAGADPEASRDRPDVLPYEEQLVREPAPVAEGIPKSS
jgi:hypothetical protein